MATDTVPAAVPGPPDPQSGTPTTQAGADKPAKGFLAAMVAPVEPARATFDLTPTTGHATHPEAGDGVLDRSAPGKSSASFHDTEQAATNDPSGQKRKAQGSIWKAWWLAGAQRWAKGGGTANKRLDLKKAQAQANQVKEARTTTVNKSGGLLPVRNSGGSGAGPKGNSGKSSGNTGGKGPVNSSGNRSGGAGRGGSGGGRGPGGGAGNNGSSSSGGRHKDSASHGKGTGTKGPTSGGKGAAGTGGSHGAGGPGRNTSSGKDTRAGKDRTGPDLKASKDTGAKGPGKSPGTGGGSGSGGAGKQGASGKSGAAGKDGKTQGPSGSGTGAAPKTDTAKTDTKHGKNDALKPSKTPSKDDTTRKTKHDKAQLDTRTPLEKSRETGHKDGAAVRQVVDHVKAYKDGAVDGYRDKRDENAKDHARLDKAHDQHKPKAQDAPKGKGPLRATAHGQTITITDDNAPLEDPAMSKPTPIQAQGIDATSITLGDGFLKGSVKRSELRRFKDYEGRLEGRINGLAKVADATKALAAQARAQADECQQLAEQAKGVKGGEKLVGSLTKLTDQANAQADEADEVHKRALKAHDFAKAVLSNVQTRYAPLYQAVVDSDEVKPAELKFYADRGVTPTNSALAA
jgi:hypothetical protein